MFAPWPDRRTERASEPRPDEADVPVLLGAGFGPEALRHESRGVWAYVPLGAVPTVGGRFRRCAPSAVLVGSAPERRTDEGSAVTGRPNGIASRPGVMGRGLQ